MRRRKATRTWKSPCQTRHHDFVLKNAAVYVFDIDSLRVYCLGNNAMEVNNHSFQIGKALWVFHFQLVCHKVCHKAIGWCTWSVHAPCQTAWHLLCHCSLFDVLVEQLVWLVTYPAENAMLSRFSLSKLLCGHNHFMASSKESSRNLAMCILHYDYIIIIDRQVQKWLAISLQSLPILITTNHYYWAFLLLTIITHHWHYWRLLH